MTWRPSFPKRTSNFDSSDHRTVSFHFATVHFKWALAQRKRLRFWIMLDMASFLTYRVLAGNGDGTVDCVHRQCFLEVFLSPCCDFHYSSIPVCVAVPSKGPKITGIQYGFPAWPLRTEIVPDSLNLWMILCTVDDDNFKLFAIFLWETPFWYCSTIFRHSIGGIGDPLPSWLLRDTATLRGSFYTQSCCQLT